VTQDARLEIEREPGREPEREPEDATSPDAGLPGDDLTEAQLEALLFVAERPLGRRELATLTGASSETIDARLGDLEVSLAGRGIRLLVDGDRVALVTAPDAGLLIGRYVGREPARLSPATLETLAIVAYRQPVTKAGIERVRGVDADYAIRSLMHRRLVVELGRADAPGRPILYGTSVDFMERFGLLSLDDLPVLDPSIAERLTASGPQPPAQDAGAARGEPPPAREAGEPEGVPSPAGPSVPSPAGPSGPSDPSVLLREPDDDGPA
jgi:segregation and condensation protein B